MDKQKFEKCIRLTESANDQEALSALRKAQNICKKNKLNFVSFVLNKQANMLDEKLDIFQRVFNSNKDLNKDTKIEFFEKFIKKYKISLSDDNWISTTVIYDKFINDVCLDISIMSIKVFSQMIAKKFKTKVVKGGYKKDHNGFLLSMEID